MPLSGVRSHGRCSGDGSGMSAVAAPRTRASGARRSGECGRAALCVSGTGNTKRLNRRAVGATSPRPRGSHFTFTYQPNVFGVRTNGEEHDFITGTIVRKGELQHIAQTTFEKVM